MRALSRLLFAVAFLGVNVERAGSDVRADELEGNLVYLPMPAGESLAVSNPLGFVRLRAWDEPQVRIVAEKRARDPRTLERLKVRADVEGGRLRITAGVRFSDGWRSVPADKAGLAGAVIDLTIDAPRGMTIDASTFGGDLDASGFRAGAHLESKHGEIRAADIQGKVDTHSLAGRQSLQGIHGPLDANGVEGDVELVSIDGATLDATVYKGQISAREIRSPVVRLRDAVGLIVFVGDLQRGGRYELSTLDGDVRMTLRPVPFHIVARAPGGVTVRGLVLRGEVQPTSVSADYDGGGASLELAAARGSIELTPR